jgi:hypothetical protein
MGKMSQRGGLRLLELWDGMRLVPSDCFIGLRSDLEMIKCDGFDKRNSFRAFLIPTRVERIIFS